MTDIPGRAVLLLVVANEADGDTEVDVDTVAYLDTGAAVTSEEDTDVDMEDVSIVEDTEEVADEDTSVATGRVLLESCMMPVLFKPCREPRW